MSIVGKAFVLVALRRLQKVAEPVYPESQSAASELSGPPPT